MAVIPHENQQHVLSVAQDRLADWDEYPDIRPSGRWIKVESYPAIPLNVLEHLATDLRDCGYRVSVVPPRTVKATKNGIDWPTVPDSGTGSADRVVAVVQVERPSGSETLEVRAGGEVVVREDGPVEITVREASGGRADGGGE